MLSAPSFRLKGGGWYETDFKKDNQRNISKNDNDVNKTKSSTTNETKAKNKEKSKATTVKKNNKST